jgi:hypothetical protein
MSVVQRWRANLAKRRQAASFVNREVHYWKSRLRVAATWADRNNATIMLRKRRHELHMALLSVRAAERVVARHAHDPIIRPTIVMYDSVDVDAIPPDAVAVAGYTSGRWPTWVEIVQRFPRARRVSIAVNASHDADCLDIEKGDATPQEAPGWVKRQIARGVKRPKLYASVSQMPVVLAELRKAGLRRGQVLLWTAHYTGQEHICSSRCESDFTEVADATQWTSKALGRNLDQSLCNAAFFG